MVDKNEQLDLNVNISGIISHEEYRKLWDKIGKIEIKMELYGK